MTSGPDLVARARAGDAAAFALLVEENQDRIYRLALRMTGNPDDARELAQEAFLHAWRGLARFQGDCAFSTWLYRLASNVCLDFLRREKRRRALLSGAPVDGGDGAVMDLPDRGCGPEEALERAEARAAVTRALGRLQPDHRRVLELREFDGLSYAEIGALLSLEEGTVKSRIARARAALRAALLADGNFSAVFPSTETEERKGGAGHGCPR